MNDSGKTVFITGTSSGIGLETALYFFERGWNVVATMRNPDQRRTPLHEKGLPDLVHLDVTDTASIRDAVRYALDKYQRIDVLVNNAGYALYGPFEATTQEQIARQFNTNVFGLMEVVREVLPVFRQQKSGVLINMSSLTGRVGFPLFALYTSTKWAVEGFTEALRYELKPLNIKVKLIEPGIMKTDFHDRSMESADCTAFAEDYGDIVKRCERNVGEAARGTSAEPRVVAQTVYRAATDDSFRVRYIAGNFARLVSAMRRLLPERMFYWQLEKGAYSNDRVTGGFDSSSPVK
jgi:NAD(P)-dependent dehydrogenase (short-subunit alcohol dehydrogenase family)